jgi:HEAT repeat protein
LSAYPNNGLAKSEGLFGLPNSRLDVEAEPMWYSKALLRRMIELPTSDAEANLIVPALTSALKDHSAATIPGQESVLQLAASILSHLGPRAQPAIPALIAAAKGKDGNLCASAIGALGLLTPHAQQVVPVLLKAMETKDVDDPETALNVRRLAIRALGRMGVDTQQTVPALKEALHDKHESIRAEAAKALQSIQR